MKTRSVVKNLLFVLVLFLAVVVTGCSKKEQDKDKDGDKEVAITITPSEDSDGWEYADQIIEIVQSQEPTFGDYSVNITDFGAEVKTEILTDKAEEAKLAKSNREAIEKAIADVTSHEDKNGVKGGTVVIPAGYTYTGAIHLDNNVNLHLEDEAHVMFTTDYAQYEKVYTRWEGVRCYNYSPLIYAYEKENIAVTGKGILDGQADKEEYWLPWKKTQRDDRNALFKMGEEGTPIEERQFGDGHFLRPSFVQPYGCKNVLIEDVTINNAPFWMVHPVESQYVTVRGVNVEAYGYNNDGINPESCQYVLIEDNEFNTGDDCIAVKSGRNADALEHKIACEFIVARNNEFNTGKGACITVGSEMSADVRYVYSIGNHAKDTVEHLQAVSLKSNGDRGGTIENIYVKDLVSESVEDHAILITLLYEEGDTGVRSPKIKDVYIDNCEFHGGKQTVISLLGYDRSPIENIHITNSTFDGCDNIFNLFNMKGLFFENTTINGKKYDGEYIPSVDNVTVNKAHISSASLTMQYSCGALTEKEMSDICFKVSDSADGPFVPVSQAGGNEFESIKHYEVTLTDIDPAKYYKFSFKINGEQWESETYHYEGL